MEMRCESVWHWKLVCSVRGCSRCSGILNFPRCNGSMYYKCVMGHTYIRMSPPFFQMHVVGLNAVKHYYQYWESFTLSETVIFHLCWAACIWQLKFVCTVFGLPRTKHYHFRLAFYCLFYDFLFCSLFLLLFLFGRSFIGLFNQRPYQWEPFIHVHSINYCFTFIRGIFLSLLRTHLTSSLPCLSSEFT